MSKFAEKIAIYAFYDVEDNVSKIFGKLLKTA